MAAPRAASLARERFAMSLGLPSALTDRTFWDSGYQEQHHVRDQLHGPTLSFLCRRLWLLPSVETDPPSNV